MGVRLSLNPQPLCGTLCGVRFSFFLFPQGLAYTLLVQRNVAWNAMWRRMYPPPHMTHMWNAMWRRMSLTRRVTALFLVLAVSFVFDCLLFSLFVVIFSLACRRPEA